MSKEQQLTPVRLSHLLGFSSVGAIVRGPHYLMVVNDTSTWTDREGRQGGKPIYYVEQVKSSLGIDLELRQPPTATEKDGWVEGTCVPAHIFPSWTKCNSCNYLSNKPWARNKETFPLPCRREGCRGRLEQLPWVMVHKSGFLDDVPFHWVAHIKPNTSEQSSCEALWDQSYLHFKQHGKNYQVFCSRCSATGTFNPLMELPWSGRQQPWVYEKPTEEDLKEAKTGKVLAVSDPRVHFTERQSALVIPPESRIKHGSVVDRLYSSAEKREKLSKAKTALAKKSALKMLATELSCEIEDIEDALAEIEKGYPLYGKSISTGNLLQSEYQALLEPIPDLSADEDFVTKHYSKEWHGLRAKLPEDRLSSRVIGMVHSVIGVERLKEVMIMKGFGRLDLSPEERHIIPPDLVGELDWLPALELYGEGVFITIEPKILEEWEAQPELIRRLQQLELRFAKSSVRFDTEVALSPRFMLLHALSHGLIRQFESHAGYPAASLKERIYCSRHDGMAGILIYVAVPDVVGSLGGLAELAMPQRLLPILMSAIEQAQWCSLDPVCSEHDGQGPDLLNKAACHGCVLIPETSCGYGNLLLDRVFVKGSEEDGISSILDFVRS